MNKNPFITKYTGPEIDKAIGESLGNIYGDQLKPGTRLVGEYIENPIDLNDLTIPGQYTAYFYLHGPKQLAKLNGNTPISISVFKNTNPNETLTTGNSQEPSLWQTIIALSYATTENKAAGIEIGSVIVNFFYRDLNSSDAALEGSTTEGYGWYSSLMTSGSTTIINNLSSNNPNAALSAYMGKYLKYLIDNDDDGTTNLLPCSTAAITRYKSSKFFSSYWDFVDGNGDVITPEYNTERDTFHKNGSFDPVMYFNSIFNSDYVRLTSTVKQNASSSYMSKLKPTHFVKIRPTDKAFTVSVYARAKTISSSISAWVEIGLYGKQSDDANSKLTSSVVVNLNWETAETGQDIADLYQTYAPSVRGSAAIPVSYEAGSSSMPWYRLTATIEGVDIFYNGSYTNDTNSVVTLPIAARYVGVSFGFTINGEAGTNANAIEFSNIKLERGKIATDSALTYPEMWHEFNNANYLNSTPISSAVNPSSAGSLKDGQGLMYSADNGNWVNKYLAAGGGGGFVAQAYPPDMYLDDDNNLLEYDSKNLNDRRRLLWYVCGTGEAGKCEISYTEGGSQHTYECYEGAFYYFNDATGKWTACESNYHVGDTAPANKALLWLDTGSIRSNYNAAYGEDEPADLKYYDEKYTEWRVVGAEPKPSFVISDTEPTGPDADLMWITSQGVASVPHWKDVNGVKTKTWLPIQAIWGHNT